MVIVIIVIIIITGTLNGTLINECSGGLGVAALRKR